MPSFFNILNRLLPFATPGTPLIQDLIHLAAICALLYFAPQIQARLQTYTIQVESNSSQNVAPVPPQQNNDIEPDHDGHIDAAPEQEVQDEVVNDEPDLARPPDIPREGEAGPAHHPEQQTRARDNVGAKKAKSLARKDQIRAYNEFMRSQGDAQRARDAEGAAEREAALAAERERRRAAESALEARKAHEREVKREREEAERTEQQRRRDLVISTVSEALDARRMCNLFEVVKIVGGDVDEVWVEKMLTAGGMLGRKGDFMTMVTSTGWVVRVTADDMRELYKRALDAGLGDEEGRIANDELGSFLANLLTERS